MKLQIENLRALIYRKELNQFQLADAMCEFERLVSYTESLEQEIKNK